MEKFSVSKSEKRSDMCLYKIILLIVRKFVFVILVRGEDKILEDITLL